MVAVQAEGGIVNRRQLSEALEIGQAVTVECLRAFSPRAQQGQEGGGVGVSIAIHIAVGRAPCAEQEQQVRGIDIAIAVEVAGARELKPDRVGNRVVDIIRRIGANGDERVALAEREIIERTLRSHGWNRQETAAALMINRTTLFNKMRKYGLLGRGRRGQRLHAGVDDE